MKQLVISGVAQAVADDPRSRTPVSDPEVLKQLDGASASESCCEYLSEELEALGLSGGRLRLAYDQASRALRVVTTYRLREELPAEQLKQLIEETQLQWSDGIGGGSFRSRRGEILSTTLAMAMGNAGQADGLGSLFVDVYPDVDERDVRHEYREAAGPNPLAWALAGLAVLIGLLVWLLK